MSVIIDGTGNSVSADTTQTINATSAINLQINGTTRAVVDSVGNFGVGLTTLTDKFEIQADANSAQAVNFRNLNAGTLAYSIFNIGNDVDKTAFRLIVGSSTATAFGGANSANLVNTRNAPTTFWTNNAERARINAAGDFLVGTTTVVSATTPGFQISVGDKTIRNAVGSTANTSQVLFYNPNGIVGSITTSGSATAYNTASDYRLKNNQQPLTGSGTFIDSLMPKTWGWSADGSKGVGFIAHEVQAVSPGSVTGEKDAVDDEGKPVYQAMEYGSAEFIANIVAELQSVRKRLAALEAK